MELTKLNAAQKQAANDEKAAGEECVKLAKQLQAVTDDVSDTVADALHVYGNCAVDKVWSWCNNTSSQLMNFSFLTWASCRDPLLP